MLPRPGAAQLAATAPTSAFLMRHQVLLQELGECRGSRRHRASRQEHGELSNDLRRLDPFHHEAEIPGNDAHVHGRQRDTQTYSRDAERCRDVVDDVGRNEAILFPGLLQRLGEHQSTQRLS